MHHSEHPALGIVMWQDQEAGQSCVVGPTLKKRNGLGLYHVLPNSLFYPIDICVCSAPSIHSLNYWIVLPSQPLKIVVVPLWPLPFHESFKISWFCVSTIKQFLASQEEL